MVPFEPPRGWLRAGARASVKYRGDSYWHERLLVWPLNSTEWVVLTPDEGFYIENLGAYEKYRRRVGNGAFDADMRKVVAFSKPLTDADMVKRMQDARASCIAERARRGERFDDGKVLPINWDGNRLEVPALTAVAGLRRKLSHKTPIVAKPHEVESPEKMVATPPTTPKGTDLDGEPAWGSDMKLAPKPDHIWCSVDVAAAYDGKVPNEIIPYGFEIQLSSGSFVFGESAIHITRSGVGVLCQQVVWADLPEMVDRHKRSMGELLTPRNPRTEALLGRLGDSKGQGTAVGSKPGYSSEECEVQTDEDVRTLWVDYGTNNARHKSWRGVVEQSTQESFNDTGLPGDPTALHSAREMLEYGGNPDLWWAQICQDHNVGKE